VRLSPLISNQNEEKKYTKKGPPFKPGKDIPVKPDEDPDPTEHDDPEKIDPTRIKEPDKNDPTRIDDPSPTKPKKPLK
jgi:hypothetical protein